VDSADEASRFLQGHGVPEDSIRRRPCGSHRPAPEAGLQAPHPPRVRGRIEPKPETTFGNVKADVLDRFVPGFERGDFVDTIENSPWPE
jgi:hypothetical protein